MLYCLSCVSSTRIQTWNHSAMTVAWKLVQMKQEQDTCQLGKLTLVIQRKGFKSTIHLIQKGYRGETNFNLIAVPLLFKDLKRKQS